jgi:hypothetical protein
MEIEDDKQGTDVHYAHTVVYRVLTTGTSSPQLRVGDTDGAGQSRDSDTSLSIWSHSVEFGRPVPTVVLGGSAGGG